VTKENATVATELHARLDAWTRQHPGDHARDKASGVVVDVDEQTRATLKALGYIR
jgi:hypothetical protein